MAEDLDAEFALFEQEIGALEGETPADAEAPAEHSANATAPRSAGITQSAVPEPEPEKTTERVAGVKRNVQTVYSSAPVASTGRDEESTAEAAVQDQGGYPMMDGTGMGGYPGPSAYPGPSMNGAAIGPSAPPSLPPAWPQGLPPHMAQQQYSSSQSYSYGNSSSSGGNSNQPQKIMRTAGGKKWEDVSLADWPKDDFRMFCGNLGNEVDDTVLARVFNKYPSFNRAKVVRDSRTKKTKGYGFVSFGDPADFTRAMREVNGKYVGNRPVKLMKSEWEERLLPVKQPKKNKGNKGK